jgi:N-acyl-D-amino-acid deacylase
MAAVSSGRYRWIAIAFLSLAGASCVRKGPETADPTALEPPPGIGATAGQARPMCSAELAPFDEVMTRFIEQHRVPGGSLAVLRDERLVCVKGYGLADRENRTGVEPGSLFRVASVSKTITATAVMRLVEQGELSLDDSVFRLLDLRRYISSRVPIDSRLGRVTVRDLLRHSGGFDREASFDPMFSSRRIARTLGIDPPPEPWDIIRYMVRRKLDFEPGTKYAYSNFGYLMLGRIVEQVTGSSYGQWVQENVFAPIGVTGARLGRTVERDAWPGEVRYYDGRGMTARSVFPEVEAEVPRPYGLWYLESMDAHGGWVMSAVDLARFSASFADPDASPLLGRRAIEQMFAPPPYAELDANGRAAESFYGLGWRVKHKSSGRENVWHTGKLEGTASAMVRRHDGIAWVVLFNTDRNPEGTPLIGLIDPRLHEAAQAVTRWPEYDLFEHVD